MSSPYDPQQPYQQPYQPGYPQDYGQQPYQPYPPAGYPPPDYPPAGYPPPDYPPPGYPPAGYQQWPPPTTEPPRRPGVLVAAGVLWLLNGAFLLVFGVITAVADQLPGFEEAMLESGNQITRDELVAVGITAAVLGAAMIGLAIVVFVNGALWARILIMVVAIVPAVLLLLTVVFPLFTIAASVLQFLPPVGRYVRARRGRRSGL